MGIHSIENFLSKTPREEFHGCWILLCLIVPRSFEQSSEHSLQVLIQVEAGDLVRLWGFHTMVFFCQIDVTIAVI